MVVESKYSIGDNVWFISNNKVIKNDITGVAISIVGYKKPEIIYTLHYDEEIKESEVFGTKEELLKSL